MRHGTLAVLSFSMLVAAGCSNPEPSLTVASVTPQPSQIESSAPVDTAPRSESPSPQRAVDDADLGPNATRDPFKTFVPKTTDPPIVLKRTRRYALDDLHLAGIVTGGGAPRALIIDPTGKGWIVALGEIVARPESLSRADARMANWRVDRIRERDVVLVLGDDASREGATRVLALPEQRTIDAIDD